MAGKKKKARTKIEDILVIEEELTMSFTLPDGRVLEAGYLRNIQNLPIFNSTVYLVQIHGNGKSGRYRVLYDDSLDKFSKFGIIVSYNNDLDKPPDVDPNRIPDDWQMDKVKMMLHVY